MAIMDQEEAQVKQNTIERIRLRNYIGKNNEEDMQTTGFRNTTEKEEIFQLHILGIGSLTVQVLTLHLVMGDKLLPRKERLCLPTHVSNLRHVNAFL